MERESATILSIDTAWTLLSPAASLSPFVRCRWRLAAVAASYQRFLAAADDELVSEPKRSGRMRDIAALLHAAASG